MLFFCQVYYAKFPPGMEQRRVLLMYPLLSKLWLNLHYIIFFISIHFHELYQGSQTFSSRIFITGDTDICQEEICIILWAQFKIALVLALLLLSLP